jgi:hypothetical protein
MKHTLMKLTLVLIGLAAFAAAGPAEQQSRAVLGKIDHQALLEAVPGIPATTAEAGKRAYGPDIKAQEEPKALDSFYVPFQKQVAAARDVIKEAVANRQRNREELAQRTAAQAEASPIVSRMGGTEKISEMSEEDQKQAAAQAVGSYTQSLSGAPGNTSSGGGMQAMMERMMNDPAYQERFEKMSKKEQEAELQKYMGNAHAPAPPSGETDAERQAKQATKETVAVVAGQNELGNIMQRVRAGDAEFDNKDKAILDAPGGHDQITKEIGARIQKLPVIGHGEAGDIVDPVKLQALQREQATRDRTRAGWELQQRAALYAQRKSQYKEVAANYTAWLKKNLGPVSNQTAQLLDDSTVEMAVDCEEQLIGLSEDLAKYTAEATRYAAQYEWSYQKKMSDH